MNDGAIARARSGGAQRVVRRVVLLGASNLTKSIGTVVAAATATWQEPLEVLAALGHGRSYGRASRYVGLVLPGIAECGLWSDLTGDASRPTAALVTDIGNDLMYEEPVERIVSWIEQCLDRLADAGATTIVTALPVANVERLTERRFRVLRSLLFPWSGITLSDVRRRALALDETVCRFARERGFATVEQQPAWYGIDPIHIRFGVRPAVWSHILSGWSPDGAPPRVARSLARTVYLRTRTPERRRVLGIEQRGRKPAARFADGTSIAIY